MTVRTAATRRFLRCRLAVALLSFAVVFVLSSCGSEDDVERPIEVVRGDDGRPAGLPAFHRWSGRVAFGGRPVGSGFSNLAAMGVDTVLTVEARVPNVAQAKRLGLRIFHVPLGYDAITQTQGTLLAAAAHGAKGLYVHCDDGGGRAPFAAMIVHKSLDSVGVDQALEALAARGLQSATGLVRSVVAFRPPSESELAAAGKQLSATTAPTGLRASMTEIGARFEQLDAWGSNGWRRPEVAPVLGGKGEPARFADVSPADQAKALAAHFESLGEPDGDKKALRLFRQYRSDASAASRLLEFALRRGEGVRRDSALRRLQVACSMCHARYR